MRGAACIPRRCRTSTPTAIGDPIAIGAMALGVDQLLRAIPIGVGATLLMDALSVFLKRGFGVRSLDYCMLGRWFRHMPAGTFAHVSIAAAEPKPGECTVGWIAHYTIGVILALGFLLVAPADWSTRPTLLPALLYGIVTVAFPFLVMQPSLGLGIASAKVAKPSRARLKSLITHSIFGLGLYLWALVLSAGLR